MRTQGSGISRGRRSTRLAGLTALVAVAAALLPASAAAAVRYASPSSVDVTGSCGSASPCRLDHAIDGAAAGDEVVVLPGDYLIAYPVRASAAIDVHGATGQPTPRLLGDLGLLDPTVEMGAGGTVSGLYVETSATTALELRNGARGDRITAVANDVVLGAEAVRLVTSPTAPALINSVAYTSGTGEAVSVVDGGSPGGSTLVNVTAIAAGLGSSGLATDAAVQSPVVRNVIARGVGKDIQALPGSLNVDLAYSNFRSGNSANWTNSGNNQTAAPAFVNEATRNYRQASGSPTIDAGTAHALVNGTQDPDGRDRSLGATPDIGAYEYVPAGGGGGGGGDGSGGSGGGPIDLGILGPGGGDATPELPPLSVPVVGESVNVEGSGRTLVRLPGSAEFVPLAAGATIPVGSTIDATRGRVELTSVRDSSGQLQTGTFWGGVFKVQQTAGPNPLTELVLTGGNFKRCRPRGKSAGAATGRHRSRVRRLWGRDRRGRFRTRGRRSHATVRGTTWLVEDRCDGTFTKVKEGAVVVRDFRLRHNVLLRKGGSYLARAR
jgi:hypothetical protein